MTRYRHDAIIQSVQGKQQKKARKKKMKWVIKMESWDGEQVYMNDEEYESREEAEEALEELEKWYSHDPDEELIIVRE